MSWINKLQFNSYRGKYLSFSSTRNLHNLQEVRKKKKKKKENTSYTTEVFNIFPLASSLVCSLFNLFIDIEKLEYAIIMYLE